MIDICDFLIFKERYDYFTISLKGGYFTQLTYFSIKKQEIIVSVCDDVISNIKIICPNPDLYLKEVQNFIIAGNSCTITDGNMTVEIIGQLF